ncbi:MAG TPA: right-handed parallel beta-helix repeat-containing protein [Puia sp.]|jgi:hypothetical protein
MIKQLILYAIWVSPMGNDHNAGSKESPLRTVAAAFRMVREERRLAAVKEPIHIILRGGEYLLEETLFVRPEDAGGPGSPTVVEAAPGEEPVVSGGVRVSGWRRMKGNIYEADVPFLGGRPLGFRQLWVNGVKAVRSRDISDEDHMNRILAVDKGREEMVIPATVEIKDAKNLEMVIHQMWATAVLRVRSVERVGNTYHLRFWEPEGQLEFEHPWPAAVIDSGHKQNGNSAYYLTNALKLLDSPGEWYEDIEKGKIYYWPRAGEDLASANVVVPALTQLVRVAGIIDRPVSYVQFKGIRFAYSTWMRPSEAGHVPLQAGMYLLDAYKLKIPGTPDKKGLENQAWIGRPPGAVEVSFADHMLFQGCRFGHMASTGVDFLRGTHADTVRDCVFTDVGGTAIQAGVYSDEAFETHLPYDPSDDRELCRDEWIENNLVTDCTNEDWGCVGISAGYVRDFHIEHNEVREVSYSGICVGWGWTRTVNSLRNNHIVGNYVHHYGKHMYDVGGIYTLSAQPGTIITENRIDSIYHPAYVHDPQHWFYFYFDEGSSYITIRNNWCPGEKFMRNANGPGNVWENNGPMVDEKIKLSAGIKKQ